MRIENEMKLDFSDVLIRPKRSALNSRKEVSLNRCLKFKYGFNDWSGIPIVASNMDTTGTFEMAEALSEFDMMVALHKHYNKEELYSFIDKHYKSDSKVLDNIFLSIGTSIAELERVKEHLPYVNKIMIDIANGYSQHFIDCIKRTREKYPDHIICAGNVVTADMAEAIILAGADIVKAGIGNGCLAGDTRILMGDGTYKNIADINIHDKVINKNGKIVDVIGVRFSGIKKVASYRNNLFYSDTKVTPCHKHWTGDCTHYKANTISNLGHKALLEVRSKNGNPNFSWASIDEGFGQRVLTVPNNIEFDIPENISVKTDQFIYSRRSKTNLNTVSIPSELNQTYELGYIIGTFLGDGYSDLKHVTKSTENGRSANTTGRVNWYFGIHEENIVHKLIRCMENVLNYTPTIKKQKNVLMVVTRSNVLSRLFNEFYDTDRIKHLPSKWWCKDKDYLTGIIDGMVDSDGSYDASSNRYLFANTSEKLLELYMVAFYIVNGYFPSVQKLQKTIGNLNNANPNNLKQVYSIGGVTKPERLMVGDWQLNKIYSDIIFEEIEIPTYDIEVDCPTHSFVANNSIVHNSACSTRIQTGVGYPQLSAVIECADAVHGLGGHLMSDGGCNTPADVAKAFGGGADLVMSGSFFAAHEEGGGEKITDTSSGEIMVKYYGMSSNTAQEKYNGGVNGYRSSEGRTILLPYKGYVSDTCKNLLGGLRSACTYVGAASIKELPKRTTFVRVNNTHNRVYEKNTIRL